jgi:sulfite exporter TauE/SafE
VLPIDSLPRALAAGMLWGWLPCGMAYGVLSVAWLSADPVHGAAIMAVFGLGTLPALVAASGLAARIGAAAGSPAWRAAAGCAIAAIGMLSIAGPWLLGDAAHATQWFDALVAACLPARGG